MNKCKKVKLISAKGTVYHDDFGFADARLALEIEGALDSRKQRFSMDSVVYSEDGKNYKRLNQMSNRGLVEISSKKLYYINYYSERKLITGARISYVWFRRSWSKTAISSVEVYEGGDGSGSVFPWQIKEGLKLRFTDKPVGTYVVTECFAQPDRQGRLCVLERLIKSEETEKINEYTITAGDLSRISKVPYEHYDEAPNETDIFNAPLREADLAPFAERGAHTFERRDANGTRTSRFDGVQSLNLYWKPIEEASTYVVSMYKIRDNDAQRSKLYLLERFYVDRNKHWLTVENLFGTGYVFVLEAERRDGEVVARSRGIPDTGGAPMWYDEKHGDGK